MGKTGLNERNAIFGDRGSFSPVFFIKIALDCSILHAESITKDPEIRYQR